MLHFLEILFLSIYVTGHEIWSKDICKKRKIERKKEMQNVFCMHIIVAQMQMLRDKEYFCVWDTR